MEPNTSRPENTEKPEKETLMDAVRRKTGIMRSHDKEEAADNGKSQKHDKDLEKAKARAVKKAEKATRLAEQLTEAAIQADETAQHMIATARGAAAQRFIGGYEMPDEQHEEHIPTILAPINEQEGESPEQGAQARVAIAPHTPTQDSNSSEIKVIRIKPRGQSERPLRDEPEPQAWATASESSDPHRRNPYDDRHEYFDAQERIPIHTTPHRFEYALTKRPTPPPRQRTAEPRAVERERLARDASPGNARFSDYYSDDWSTDSSDEEYQVVDEVYGSDGPEYEADAIRTRKHSLESIMQNAYSQPERQTRTHQNERRETSYRRSHHDQDYVTHSPIPARREPSHRQVNNIPFDDRRAPSARRTMRDGPYEPSAYNREFVNDREPTGYPQQYYDDRREQVPAPMAAVHPTSTDSLRQSAMAPVQIINPPTKIPEMAAFTNSFRDKQSFEEFKDEFQIKRRALCIPEMNWARLVVIFLTEGALAFYKSMVKADPRLADDYDKLMTRLQHQFDHSGGLLAEDLHSRTKKKNETIGAYYLSLITLAKRSYPEVMGKPLDHIIRRTFVRGLPHAYQRLLINRQPKTAEKAFQMAERYERCNETLLKDATTAAGREAEIMAVAETERDKMMRDVAQSLKALEMRERERAEIEDIEARRKNREAFYKIPHRNFHHERKERREQYRRTGRLDDRRRFVNPQPRYSGLPEERLQQQRQYQARQPPQKFTDNGRPICQYCGKSGHLKFDCYQLQGDDRRQQERERNKRVTWGHDRQYGQSTYAVVPNFGLSFIGTDDWRSMDKFQQLGEARFKASKEYNRMPESDVPEQPIESPSPEDTLTQPKLETNEQEATDDPKEMDPKETTVNDSDLMKDKFLAYFNQQAKMMDPKQKGNRFTTQTSLQEIDATLNTLRTYTRAKRTAEAVERNEGTTPEKFVKRHKHTYTPIPTNITKPTLTSFIRMLLLILTVITGAGSSPNPMMCHVDESNHSPLMLKIPQNIRCHTPSEKNSAIQPLNFQFYKRKRLYQQQRAHLCYKQITTTDTFLGPVGIVRDQRQTNAMVPTSVQECEQMVDKRNVHGMQLIEKQGKISTHLSTAANYTYCCKWVTEKTINYVLVPGYVYLNGNSKHIKTTLGHAEKCKYELGYCNIKQTGMLIWTPDRKRECDFEPWIPVNGTLHQDIWLSTQRDLVLTFKDYGLNRMQVCPQTQPTLYLLKADQGMYARNLTEIKENVTEKITPKMILATTGNNTSSSHLVEYINAMVQSLSEDIYNQTKTAFWDGVRNLCTHTQLMANLITRAVMTDATAAIRHLLKDDYVQAKALTGEVIAVYPCIALEEDEYDIDTEPEVLCSDWIPLRLNRKSNFNSTAYLDPITNIIHKYSPHKNCKGNERVYYQLENNTFRYDWFDKQSFHTNLTTSPLSNAFQMNYSYHPETMKIFRERLNVLPLESMDSTGLLLDDLMETLTSERKMMQNVGLWPTTGTGGDNPFFINTDTLSLLHWVKSGLRKAMIVWNIIVNATVTLGVIGIIVMWIRRRHHQYRVTSRAQRYEETYPLRNISMVRRTHRQRREPRNQHRDPTGREELRRSLYRPEADWTPPNAVKPSFEDPVDRFGKPMSAEDNPYPVPRVWGRVNEVPAVIFIDTGSAYNIVSCKQAEKLGLEVRPTTTSALSVTGEPVKLLGETYATVNLGNRQFTARFLVSPESSCDILIGFRALWHYPDMQFDIRARRIRLAAATLELIPNDLHLPDTEEPIFTIRSKPIANQRTSSSMKPAHISAKTGGNGDSLKQNGYGTYVE